MDGDSRRGSGNFRLCFFICESEHPSRKNYRKASGGIVQQGNGERRIVREDRLGGASAKRRTSKFFYLFTVSNSLNN